MLIVWLLTDDILLNKEAMILNEKKLYYVTVRQYVFTSVKDNQLLFFYILVIDINMVDQILLRLLFIMSFIALTTML